MVAWTGVKDSSAWPNRCYQLASANPPGTALPPGLEKRDQLPPGLSKRDELQPGLAERTNQFGGSITNGFLRETNQFGVITNQFLQNQFGATGSGSATNTGQLGITTNQGGLTPTSTQGATNQIFGTNAPAGGSGTMNLRQDQASTSTDRTLLFQVRQTVQAQISTFTATSPVHFMVRSGIVTLVGFVPSLEVKQKIFLIVQGVPGVIRVIDNLQLGTGFQGAIDGQTPVPDDQTLLMQVRRAVLPAVGASSASSPVQVGVQNGTVTLAGQVQTAEQKQRLEALARQVPGVVAINNQIVVPVVPGTTPVPGGSP